MMRLTPPMSAIEALNSICKTDDSLARHKRNKRQLYIFLRHIHSTYDPEEKLGNRYIDYLGANLDAIEAAVAEEARDEDSLEKREPMTSLQFEKFHDMVNSMVDKLIAQSYYDELPGDPDKARRNLNSLDSAWTAIRMLRSEGYPRYTHPSVDPARSKHSRAQLAQMIETLFYVWDTEKAAKPKFQVAKVCYNLLVCPIPPSIHHYNLLLLGFIKKKKHNLVDIVAESLLEDSRLRPTTQTIVCLLVHYRQKGDIHGFYNIIRRMMAIDNRGLLIRRRWYADVVNTPALHQWANKPEVTTSLKANWVIERPSRSQDIYEALVSGLLSFGRIKDAVKVFIGSLQEGVGTSVELFTYMLKQCLYTLDVSAADILVRGLVDNTPTVTSLLLRSSCPRRLAEQLYPILNMGKPPSWPFSKARAQLAWSSAAVAVSPQDKDRVRLLATALFIRQTETQLSRLHKALYRASYILDVEHPEKRTIIALCAIAELNELQRHHHRVAGKLLKHQALLKVTRLLEANTWDIAPGKIGQVHHRVVRMLEGEMPHEPKEGGYEKWEHNAEISEVADHWLQHRISKIQGGQSDARRLELEAELAFIVGQRLMEDSLRLLASKVAWASPLDASKEAAAARDVEEASQEDEDAAGGSSLWPTAEAGANSGGGLSWAGYADRTVREETRPARYPWATSLTSAFRQKK